MTHASARQPGKTARWRWVQEGSLTLSAPSEAGKATDHAVRIPGPASSKAAQTDERGSAELDRDPAIAADRRLAATGVPG